MPDNYNDQTYYGGYLNPAQITETPSTRAGRQALRKTQNLSDILTIRNGGPNAQKALTDYIHRGTNQFAKDFGSVLGAQALLLAGAGVYPQIADYLSGFPDFDTKPRTFLELYFGAPAGMVLDRELTSKAESKKRAEEQANGIYKVPEEGAVENTPENYDAPTYYGGQLPAATVTGTAYTRAGRRAVDTAARQADIAAIRRGGPGAQKALIDYINRGRNNAATDLMRMFTAQGLLMTAPGGLIPAVTEGDLFPALGVTPFLGATNDVILEKYKSNPEGVMRLIPKRKKK